MRALSLWQPHAQAIGLGLKIYETRGWPTSYRGPLAIHAAKKKFDYRHYPPDYYQEVARRFKEVKFPLFALDYGKIICVVDVLDCTAVHNLRGRIGGYEFWGDFRDRGDDGKQRYAFKLGNVRLIPPTKRPTVVGRQGFFTIDSSIIQFT